MSHHQNFHTRINYLYCQQYHCNEGLLLSWYHLMCPVIFFLVLDKFVMFICAVFIVSSIILLFSLLGLFFLDAEENNADRVLFSA